MPRPVRFLVPLFLLACTTDLVFPPDDPDADGQSPEPTSDTTATTPPSVEPARPTTITIETVIEQERYFGNRCRSEYTCGSEDYRHRPHFVPVGDTIRLDNVVDIGARVYDQYGKRMRDLDVEWHLTEPISYVTEHGDDLPLEVKPYIYGWGGNIVFRGCMCHIARLNNGNNYPAEPHWTSIVATLQVSDSLTLADTATVITPMRLSRNLYLLDEVTHLEVGQSGSMDLTELFESSRGLPITHTARVSKLWGSPPGPVSVAVDSIVGNDLTVRGIANGVMRLVIEGQTAEETGLMLALVYSGTIPCPAMGAEPGQRFRIEISHTADLAPCVRSTIEGAAGWWEKALASTDLPASTSCGTAGNTLAVTVETKDYRAIFGPIAGGYISCIDSLPRSGGIILDESMFLGVDGDPRFHTANINLMYQTVRHEIGHVLGLAGYAFPSLVEGDAFMGYHAVTEFKRLGGAGDMVPLEQNDAAHWSKDALRVELMTRSMGVAEMPPVSAITLGALADIGWGVDMSVAEAYEIEQRHRTASDRERVVVFHEAGLPR